MKRMRKRSRGKGDENEEKREGRIQWQLEARNQLAGGLSGETGESPHPIIVTLRIKSHKCAEVDI